jgi:kynureninase
MHLLIGTKPSRHQLSGHAITSTQFQMERNQGIISGKLSYQNGKTPAYLVFQELAILFHKRNGNTTTGKSCILTNLWIRSFNSAQTHFLLTIISLDMHRCMNWKSVATRIPAICCLLSFLSPLNKKTGE